MDSEKRIVSIISTRRFQCELLAQFLQAELDLLCIIRSPSDLNSRVTDKEESLSMILWDCNGRDPDDSWSGFVDRINARWRKPYLALFNAPKNNGIEFNAIRRGVHGIFFTDTESALLTKGIKAILDGELWYSRDCLAKFLQDSTFETGSSPGNDQSKSELLTPKENQVLHKVAAGFSTSRIAADFSISPHTVKTHLRNIYKKLGVKSRFEAIRWFSRNI